MTKIRIRPGAAAAQAFRLGIVAGGVLGLAAVALLYYTGTITLVLAGFALALLFPVYLVLVAAVLSRWLGYAPDASSLRPVTRTERAK